MTHKEFINKVTNSHKDFISEFINILKFNRMPFCVIGGLAVNAYVEPVVSLDLDVVVVVPEVIAACGEPRPCGRGTPRSALAGARRALRLRKGINNLIKLLRKRYKVSIYQHSINVAYSQSDLRIQIQIDPRYQSFIGKARVKNVLGYRLPVARIEDVFQGKTWAAQDPKRRPSKRQKDLADILRLVETKNSLKSLIPASLKRKLVL